MVVDVICLLYLKKSQFSWNARRGWNVIRQKMGIQGVMCGVSCIEFILTFPGDAGVSVFFSTCGLCFWWVIFLEVVQDRCVCIYHDSFFVVFIGCSLGENEVFCVCRKADSIYSRCGWWCFCCFEKLWRTNFLRVCFSYLELFLVLVLFWGRLLLWRNLLEESFSYSCSGKFLACFYFFEKGWVMPDFRILRCFFRVKDRFFSL